VLTKKDQEMSLAVTENNGGNIHSLSLPLRTTQLPATQRSVPLSSTHSPQSPQLSQYSYAENGVVAGYCAGGYGYSVHAFEPADSLRARTIGRRTTSSPSEDDSRSMSTSPPLRGSRASRIRKNINLDSDRRLANPHPDLIRNAPKPVMTDFSANAQIIRTARSDTGVGYDFTWSQHRQILYVSVVSARISELNTKLSTGLPKRPLIREIAAEQLPEYMRPLAIFTTTSMQRDINWMWCEEHIALLNGLDLGMPEMGPEHLDVLVKRTGAWVVDNKRAAENEKVNKNGKGKGDSQE
jgi:hypothetical protein